MDHKANLALTLAALAVVATFSTLPASASRSIAAPPPYSTNHTVGGSAGWFFDLTTNSAATDYTTWASSRSFHLGDYLIFYTDNPFAVVQTYNKTTYSLCSAADDDGNGTLFYTSGEMGEVEVGTPVMMAVPLTAEGESYYFSYAYEGTQCTRGMRFQISVGAARDPAELTGSSKSSTASEAETSGVIRWDQLRRDQEMM